MAIKLFSRNRDKAGRATRDSARHGQEKSTLPLDDDFNPAPTPVRDSDRLAQLYRQGRYALILRERERWQKEADGAEVIDKSTQQLEHQMGLVPAGRVTLSTTLSAALGSPEQEVDVEPFLLDVHAVTNSRFQQFVDGGGYDALECWPQDIWPHLIEFKDRSGQAAPRCWLDGRHDVALGDHPVVGITWYEAQAYALWIGQRLPAEGEWEMAASWHIRSSTDCVRRFPWGDTMDSQRCNVWSSRKKGTTPVSEYEKGAAPNQVRQLVGNVWEWTDSEFFVTDDEGRPIVGEMPMRVVRGGAFDTYFDTQAASAFRSGQLVLARPHNTGFRCAMNLADAYWMHCE